MEARLRDAVAAVRAGLAARYPVVVDHTRWTWDDGVRVEGGVLVAAMADAYADAITEAVGPCPRPLILADVDAPWTAQRWARAHGDAPLDLHRGADVDDLQTQWTPPCWLRRFADRGGRALVQLPDGTLGWLDAARLRDEAPAQDPWASLRRARADQVITAEEPLSAAEARARARLGRPYRWGGNTDEAADCSGFVQSVVAAAGVLLPKNTGDQRATGLRVARGAIAPGDLLFVRGRDKRLAHVGLVLRGVGGPSVAHSCLSRAQVLEEPLADFLARYDFVACRRPVLWPDVGAPRG